MGSSVICSGKSGLFVTKLSFLVDTIFSVSSMQDVRSSEIASGARPSSMRDETPDSRYLFKSAMKGI